jgi:hypothetical protein
VVGATVESFDLVCSLRLRLRLVPPSRSNGMRTGEERSDEIPVQIDHEGPDVHPHRSEQGGARRVGRRLYHRHKQHQRAGTADHLLSFVFSTATLLSIRT